MSRGAWPTSHAQLASRPLGRGCILSGSASTRQDSLGIALNSLYLHSKAPLQDAPQRPQDLPADGFVIEIDAHDHVPTWFEGLGV